MQNLEKELEVAKSIAVEAGKIMLEYFDSDQQVELKADNSPVTIADKKINDLVIEELQKHFSDGIIGEEKSTAEYGMGRRWVCDPIDGTMGFIWGTPTSMFSLALVIDGKATLGVAYDPFLNKMNWAISGQGAYCNDKNISVSKLPLDAGVFALGSGFARSEFSIGFINALQKNGSKFASFSGAVYKACLVARGKFTGFLSTGLSAHDVAAVDVIVTEAGGKVTALDCSTLDYLQPIKGALITNGIIHDQIIELLKST